MTARPLIAGNWKMFTDRGSALALAKGLSDSLGRVDDVEVGLFPPFPFLGEVGAIAEGQGYSLGAQNLSFEQRGAFTGEVSGSMLVSVGCRYVLVGHSERRHVLGENDETIARKVKAALEAGLSPILCVGETLEERESGKTEAVVGRQTSAVVSGLSAEQFDRLTVAYEPVWAIGTGLTATSDQAQKVHAFLGKLLEERFGSGARNCRILYGGSVKPENIQELMSVDEIRGVLVGGASLQVESFTTIVRGSVVGTTG